MKAGEFQVFEKMLFVLLTAVASPVLAAPEDRLSAAWSTIFPTGNRNAGGPQFFKWIHDNAQSEYEFDEMNKLYCGVSGSIVRPGSTPDYVEVQRVDGTGTTCGDYYRCCWPCSCDLQKYARVETMSFTLGGQNVERSVLSISDPCSNPDAVPYQVNTYKCSGGRTANAVQTPTERIVMAALLNPDRNCGGNKDSGLEDSCAARNDMTVCELERRGGMGDIFAKLSCVGNATRPECMCANGEYAVESSVGAGFNLDATSAAECTTSSDGVPMWALPPLLALLFVRLQFVN